MKEKMTIFKDRMRGKAHSQGWCVDWTRPSCNVDYYYYYYYYGKNVVVIIYFL